MCVALGMMANRHTALANGRYPAAQQLVIDPTDHDQFWLRATYGILTSSDGGKSWDWICEAAVGYRGQQDPMLAATADGKLFVATEEGLRSTSDRGCTWSSDNDLGHANVTDIAVEGDGLHVLALVLVPRDSSYDLVVYRSGAESQQFVALSPAISSDLLGQTLDPAPSDARRIYVTGIPFSAVPGGGAEATGGGAGATGEGVLLRSPDGGLTWTRRPIPGTSPKSPAFIAAVHPTNPDIVYVRVQGELRSDGRRDGSLLYTDDAGDSWREIFRAQSDILGFSLSDDGGELWLGLGHSQDPPRAPVDDTTTLGIYHAESPGFFFTQLRAGQVGCLTRGTDGLFVCGTHATEMFELALSRDNGATVSPLFDLGAVRGPLACGRTQSMCGPEWPNSCAVLGTCAGQLRSTEGVPVAKPPAPQPTNAGGCAAARRIAEGVEPAGSMNALILAVVVAFAKLHRRRR